MKEVVMFRKLLFATILALLPAVLFAQDGKLRGRVTDSQSGEPLIGANVVIEGTSLGASSDINGDYIILGVPPGVYSVRTSYIGYAPVTISNVRVGSNITETLDFQLTSSTIQVEAVEVFADRPLIQKNTTNTVRVTTTEDIKNLPFRGLQNILALQAGVVQKDNNLYVRGGRAGEVAYFIDGAAVTNPVFNTENVSVIQEAIEELQLQAGGYTAELGGSNSAVARTTLRSGGTSYHGSLDYQTDDFAGPGNSFLGTSAFGYRNAVLTVGGPVPSMSNIRFFVAAQHNYLRQRSPMFLSPFKFEGLVEDGSGNRPAGTLLPNEGTLEFKENYLYNNPQENNVVQGNVIFDMSPFKIKAEGSYGLLETNTRGDWPGALYWFYAQNRNRLQQTQTMFGNVRLTHVLNPTTFYEIGVSAQSRDFREFDRDFGQNWMAYMDSSANAALGDEYDVFQSKYQGPQDYKIIDAFSLAHENAPNNFFAKNNQFSIGASADFTSQMTGNWELKAGGRLDRWTVRNFSVGSIENYLRYRFGEDGKSPKSIANGDWVDEHERRVLLSKRGTINHYGYDVDGKRSDDGFDAAPQPMFASAYVQNRFEYRDLVLNFGVRYEYFDKDRATFPSPEDYVSTSFNQSLDIIDEAKLVESDPFQLVLPRISFSFPVTENTVFYAQYGKYAQMPSLNRLYVGNTSQSRTVSPVTRGNAYLTYVGLFMQPERTTQYELGIRQLLSDNFAFTLTGFYKDLKDQLATRLYAPTGNRLFIAYLNQDFGTTKGLELTLELRRTNRLSTKVNYTLSDARGTGSNPNASQGAIEQNIGRPINIIGPLVHNQTHRGTLMLDYRWGKGDGGAVLEGLGFNALLTFNSGHNYTKIRPLSELGQSNPWTVGVEPLIDPRASFPVEPVNASTTPWVFNVDVNVSKVFYLANVTAELYVNVLNLFNSKQVLNVYPTTGTSEDDGWLTQPAATQFIQDQQYVDFYRAINLENRWAYMNSGTRSQQGNDIYGTPRQIRVGLKLEI